MRQSARSDKDTSKKKLVPAPSSLKPAQLSKRRALIRCNSYVALGCPREHCLPATMHRSHLHSPSLRSHSTATFLLDLSELYNMKIPEASLSESQSYSSDTSLPHPIHLDLPHKIVEVHGSNRWNFDIFAHRRLCSSQLICSLGMHLLETHDLFRQLHLPHSIMWETLAGIESAYWEHNPYHTAMHAADVTQAMHCFISQPKLYQLLSPLEILASLLAAFCHDVDHPGVNQTFLQRTDNFLVSLYNADSVLEQHHTRVGLAIMHQCGLVNFLTPESWNVVRDYMLQLITATNMSYQDMYRMKFSRLLDTKKASPASQYTTEDRILMLQVSLKCADISNACRPWPLCRQWAHKVCEEFFAQGDQERSMFGSVSAKLFDRTVTSIPMIQIGFANNLLRPLYTLWHDFFHTELSTEVIQWLDSNYETWIRLKDTPSYRLKSKEPVRSKLTSLVTVPSGPPGEPKSVKKEASLRQPQSCNVIELKLFGHNAPCGKQQRDKSRSSSKELDCLSKTFLITTRGLRRHSLPETQGAIRKTFNLVVAKRSKSPSSKSILYCSAKKWAENAIRTASANILQTLCEEFVDHDPTVTVVYPFPLPAAWIKSDLPPDRTSLNFDRVDTVTVMHLTHRRSSVPLLKK